MIFGKKSKKKINSNETWIEENLKKEIKDSKEKESTEKKGFFSSLKKGLSKTREILTSDIEDLFTGNRLNLSHLEELEEKLISSDLGVKTSMELISLIEQNESKIKSPEELKNFIKNQLLSFMKKPEEKNYEKPHVILVTGVNGVGKTTTIGKLAYKFSQEGKSVLIGAADTFRAAAIEQLEKWAKRSESDFVRHKEKTDPAAVAFDSVDAGIARKKDIIIIDTAGRLHNKDNLMKELVKIRSTINKRLEGAPHEVLLVVDASTGQNALNQAKIFNEAVNISGIIITKMDGTAKGGIAAAIQKEFNIPVEYIGVGEKIEDLQKFDPQSFLDAILA
ncbi:MAG: signal recognition particle-docking protein FtsY [Desulforegulaceae bacterium]|jgi:fused signal recognition particle receptor|nr:signal recognition particle-docking protein FtsY [Desulforegulaceae bacterium]